MINFELIHPGAKMPARATAGSAGYDLCALTAGHLHPSMRKLVKTGLRLHMPAGYAALVLPRSGLAVKYGVHVLNGPGLIDSDYDGEICVILHNAGDKWWGYKPGERIAQLLFIRVETIGDIVETARDGGFGSTDKQ